MVGQLTDEGRAEVEMIAGRHGVSTGAAETLLWALVAGGGTQAQFSHPELGGMGQWSRGGMLMIGDMFNNGLKAKVDALANDLSALATRGGAFAAPRPAQSQSQQSQFQGGQSQGGQSQGFGGGVSLFVPGSGSGGWPEELGFPSSTGSQNTLRYAVFPATRRLAVDEGGGRIRIYDTGDHAIGGVSQAQSGDQTLTFTSQHGLVRLADLPLVSAAAETQPQARPETQPETPRETWAEAGPKTAEAPGTAGSVQSPATAEPVKVADHPGAPSGVDIFATLERLAALRDKGILTPAEFDAKKAELLARI